MGKSTPKAPAAPDPVATANAQTASNKETAVANAKLNRVNQITPYGNLTYTNTGGDVPQYTSTQTFSPEQQRLYDLETASQTKMGTVANEQLGRLQNSLNQPINYDGLPEYSYKVDPNVMDVSRVRDALMSRINPQLEQQKGQLEARLASQGIGIGSEAYANAMKDYGQQANDMLMQAELSAGNEQNRKYNLAMQQNAAQNAARQQGIAERAQLRSQPLNEISALMSGSQVSSPQFVNVPTTQVAGTDTVSPVMAQYNSQYQNYQNKVNSRNANMGALSGLFGTGLSAGLMPGGFFGLGGRTPSISGA